MDFTNKVDEKNYLDKNLSLLISEEILDPKNDSSKNNNQKYIINS